MDRSKLAASVLTAAMGLAMAASVPAVAQQMPMSKDQMMQVQQANKARMMAGHLEKCYGINAVARNDCAAGVHSCSGQATQARDKASFVLLPGGDCAKIAGGALKPA